MSEREEQGEGVDCGMIKKVWLVQCDLCGKMEKARLVDRQYNEQQPTLPTGWGYNYNGRVHLCPECFKRVYGAGIRFTLMSKNEERSLTS